jgi:hypothetical protein
MSEISELAMRILSILEELSYENVPAMMNTIMQPVGDASELVDMQGTLQELVFADLVRMCMELDASGQLRPLPKDESINAIEDLGSGLRFDSERALWTDTRRKGPPFGLAFPFMLATKEARAKGREILEERGYQWWRSKNHN